MLWFELAYGANLRIRDFYSKIANEKHDQKKNEYPNFIEN